MQRVLSSIFVAFVVLTACFGISCTGSTNLISGLASCATDGDCPDNYQCGNGRCWRNGENPFAGLGDAAAACSAPLIDCGGGTCVDPFTNTQHCGATPGCGIEGAGSAGDSCVNGLVCNIGVCAVSCPGSQVNCDGTCVDPISDPRHCGATAGCGAVAGTPGEACINGQVCSEGACASSCSVTNTNCSGSCVDTNTNPVHCGNCATACALANVMTDACVNGACAVAACGAGFGDCDGVAANGCETVTTASDINNCGGCGLRCQYANAGAQCNAGTCARTGCDLGFADCDGDPANGCEVDTRADNGNCGTCLNACGGGQVCSVGACATTCGGGMTNCSGGCFDLTSSPSHCGACANSCSTGPQSIAVCAASSCASVCQAGFGDCNFVAGDGCEINLQNDSNHCGTCGQACVGGGTCTAGSCPVLYAVGVTVSGLTGTGLVLQNNGGHDLTVNAAGSYPFTIQLANGAAYSVTVRTLPTPTQYCAPISGSGTVMGASVNIAVSCFTLPTGGAIADVGGYRIHTFTSSGTFQTFGPMNVDYLVVGGGGGGGSGDGGGGGGGGVVAGSNTTGTISYSVVVGSGGAGAGLGETGTAATNGLDSSFLGANAVGGGHGGREDNTGGGGPKNFAGNGGSGGGFAGANAASPFPAGGSGTVGQGNMGGTRGPGSFGMGGGGGAGGVGGDGTAGNQGGAGGAGLGSSISSAPTYYAAGGGGAGRAAGGGIGGVGGGGNGALPNANGIAGTVNTGSGGGGGGDQATSGGAGGSGVVIVRYPFQ